MFLNSTHGKFKKNGRIEVSVNSTGSKMGILHRCVFFWHIDPQIRNWVFGRIVTIQFNFVLAFRK